MPLRCRKEELRLLPGGRHLTAAAYAVPLTYGCRPCASSKSCRYRRWPCYLRCRVVRALRRNGRWRWWRWRGVAHIAHQHRVARASKAARHAARASPASASQLTHREARRKSAAAKRLASLAHRALTRIAHRGARRERRNRAGEEENVFCISKRSALARNTYLLRRRKWRAIEHQCAHRGGAGSQRSVISARRRA